MDRIFPQSKKNYRPNRKPGILEIAVFAFFAVIIILFLQKKFVPAQKYSRERGWLHTRNGRILDQAGKETVLRGINYNELVPLDFVYSFPDMTGKPEICKRYIPKPPVKLDPQAVSRMGFNAVRLSVNWDQLETAPPEIDSRGNIIRRYRESYLAALDETIGSLKREGLAVILDMHQYLWSNAFKYIESEDGWGCSGSGMPAWLYPKSGETTFQKARCDFFRGDTLYRGRINAQDLFLDAWKMLIARYRDNQAVIGADIINEPWVAPRFCSASDLKLDAFYYRIGREIQAVNPNLLLFIQDSQDFGNDDFAVINPAGLPNLVYSFHLYTNNWNPDGLKRLQRFAGRAKKFNLPLFVGEFDGFGLASGKQLLEYNEALSEFGLMMTYLKKEKISWAFWSYSGYENLVDSQSGKPKQELLGILRKGMD